MSCSCALWETAELVDTHCVGEGNRQYGQWDKSGVWGRVWVSAERSSLSALDELTDRSGSWRASRSSSRFCHSFLGLNRRCQSVELGFPSLIQDAPCQRFWRNSGEAEGSQDSAFCRSVAVGLPAVSLLLLPLPFPTPPSRAILLQPEVGTPFLEPGHCFSEGQVHGSSRDWKAPLLWLLPLSPASLPVATLSACYTDLRVL